MINWKDYLIFAILLVVAQFVASLVAGFIPDLSNMGLLGSVLVYLVVLFPVYYILDRFWRRRRR